MKIKIWTIAVGITLMCNIPVFAQNGFSTIERKVLNRGLATIEDYEVLSSVSDDEAYYSFLELFKNENTPVYNDLLGYTGKNTLTAKEYAEYQQNKAQNTQVFIANIKRERLWKDADTWKVEYSFEKSITYSNECGIYFSNKDFYDRVYTLNVVLAYSEKEDKCLIERITGQIDSDRVLSDEYFTFLKTSDSDNSLRYNGHKLSYNAFDQTFLTSGISNDKFGYSDPDVVPIPVVDYECRTVTMNYKARRFMLKAHYDIGLGDAFNIEKSSLLTEYKTESNNIGLELGYYSPSKSACKVGLFFGVGMSQSKMSLSYNSPDYTFVTNADIDGDSYNRHYKDLSISQNVSLTELNIPLYLDINFRLGQYVSMYFDLGAKANLNMSNKVDGTEGSAYVYGVYPQYGNLMLNEHWGYNGFGAIKLSDNLLTTNEVLDISKFTTDAFGGVGFRIFIPNSTLAIDLGATYQMGLIETIKQNSSPVELRGSTNSPSSALIFNNISGTSSNEYLRSLTEGIGSVKRQSLKLSIGLALKF